jgi:hypothetical protein
MVELKAASGTRWDLLTCPGFGMLACRLRQLAVSVGTGENACGCRLPGQAGECRKEELWSERAGKSVCTLDFADGFGTCDYGGDAVVCPVGDASPSAGLDETRSAVLRCGWRHSVGRVGFPALAALSTAGPAERSCRAQSDPARLRQPSRRSRPGPAEGQCPQFDERVQFDSLTTPDLPSPQLATVLTYGAGPNNLQGHGLGACAEIVA